jgi:hypothetical protein
MDITYQKLNKKLDLLQTRTQNHSYTRNQQHQFYLRVINLPNTAFSNEQLNNLNLGLDFAFEQSPQKHLDNLFVETENAILPYFPVDNAHIMYNAHPVFFRFHEPVV